eukprot:116749-Pelagomonas_calceolata.AAC.1
MDIMLTGEDHWQSQADQSNSLAEGPPICQPVVENVLPAADQLENRAVGHRDMVTMCSCNQTQGEAPAVLY